jgi:hypothetical protein
MICSHVVTARLGWDLHLPDSQIQGAAEGRIDDEQMVELRDALRTSDAAGHHRGRLGMRRRASTNAQKYIINQINLAKIAGWLDR